MSRLSRVSLTAILVPIMLAASGALAFTTARYVVHDYRLRTDETALRQEIDQLDHDQLQLAAVREYLASDEYVEEIARRILGLVRPGETLVVVAGTDRPSTHAGDAASRDAPEPAGPWWRDLFVGPATEGP